MEDLNFKSALRKVLAEIEKSATLNRNGMNLMNKLISSLNSKLVNFCLENPSDEGLNIVTARNAVDSVLTGLLKDLAFAEGDRILMLYSHGLMIYQPRYPFKRKTKTKKAIAAAALQFSGGISDLVSVTFPEASLQDQAKRIVCELIEELALKISDFVQSKSKTAITKDDINTAISKALPPELLKHALAEAARMLFMFEAGLIEEPSKRIAERAVQKDVAKKPFEEEPKKPRTTRKRKRSPSRKVTPSPKRRRRKPSSRKAPRKRAVRKVSRSKTRKRTPSRKVERKVTRKKRASRKIKPRRPTKPKPARKRRVSKKVSRKKPVPRTPSRKRPVSRKRPRKRPTRVSPKRIKKVSRKKPLKEDKKVSASREIANRTKTEIGRGISNLNASFRQKLPTSESKVIRDFVCNLLDHLITEMKKLKSSTIGPQEVRRSVMKIFPQNLADLAVAHMNRILMT